MLDGRIHPLNILKLFIGYAIAIVVEKVADFGAWGARTAYEAAGALAGLNALACPKLGEHLTRLRVLKVFVCGPVAVIIETITYLGLRFGRAAFGPPSGGHTGLYALTYTEVILCGTRAHGAVVTGITVTRAVSWATALGTIIGRYAFKTIWAWPVQISSMSLPRYAPLKIIIRGSVSCHSITSPPRHNG